MSWKSIMKSVSALLLAGTMFTGFGAVTTRHVTILQSYEQLSAYTGQDGLFFVANAASSTADGAHGDPTVKSGWAMYIYAGSNVSAGTGVTRGGWRKVCEGESLDSSVNEMLLRNYVAYYVRSNDLATIARTYETKEHHNTEIAVIRNDISSHEDRLTTAEGDIANLKSRTRAVETKADRNMDDIAVINQKLDDMQLDEVRRNLIDATNRVTIAEANISNTIEVVNQAVADVNMVRDAVATNTCRIGELELAHNVNSQRIDGVEATIVTKEQEYLAGLQEAISNLTHSIELAIADAKLHSDTNDVVTVAAAKSYADTVGANAVTQAESIADTKKAEAITAAASDAATKANAAKEAAIAAASEDATVKDATNLQAAKDYTDAAVAAATDRTYVDAQDAAVSNNVIAIAAADATEKANKSYADATNYVETTASNCVAIVSDIADQKETELRQADADNLNTAKQYTDDEIAKVTGGNLRYFRVGPTSTSEFQWTNDLFYTFGSYQTVIGAGATNGPIVKTYKYDGRQYDLAAFPTAINIGIAENYPSFTYSDFAINLGIDNKVGFGTGTSTNSNNEIYNARYAIGIGTSVKSKMMHSYTFGSQINALMGNTTVIGYGGSATSEWSTVIGHGRRPNGGSSTYDKQFTTWEEADTYLKTLSANTFKGSHFEVKPDGGVRTLYTITGVRSEPNADGYYYDYLETPDDEYDYIPGGYDWRYGKSHGPGTFNIVAWHRNWRTSPGLKAVWINDDCLDNLVLSRALDSVLLKGPELTTAQKNKGITYVSNGYAEDGAVEIGVDAQSMVSEEDVRALNTANSKIRNVGIAIGTRAISEGSGPTKNQSISIGYSAHSIGSCAMAIGPGARHFDDEDDLTGNNAYANGSTATAIGYSSKAIGTGALSIGAGISGTGVKNKAEGNYATAIGGASQATAGQAVALGYQANAGATGAVQIGTGTNNEANTLKFQNTTIVKNGKICGFDDTSLDPKEISFDGLEEIDVYPHIVNTLAVTNNCGPGTELGLNPKGSRNYEVFVPNDEQFMHGLPLCFNSELPDGIQCLFVDNKQDAATLPVMIKVQQPSKKVVLITVKEIDDGTDWTPAVTNSFIRFDSVAGKFYCEGNKRSIEGKSLHHATEFKIAYPTTGGVATNDFMTVHESDGLIPGTYYDYAAAGDFTPESPVSIDDGAAVKTWYEIIYKTVNGESKTLHVDLDSVIRPAS